MPRNVRNWWLDGSIDGLRVVGYALQNGTLRLEVIDPQTHQTLAAVVTSRDLPGRLVTITDDHALV
jgi:hypothetical protein